MKKSCLISLLSFFLCLPALAATPITVSGTLQTGTSSALQGNAFVRFRLRNYAGFVPRITGTSVIVQTQADVRPNSSGVFSTSLYSNDDISPNTCGTGGDAACTWWTIEYWNNGKVASTGNYCIPNTSPTYDLNGASPCVTPPLPPSPSIPTTGTVQSVGMTGDNVIFNTVVTGSPITSSGVLVPVLKTQAQNSVLAGPTSGSGTPTFRALTAADVPAATSVPFSGITGSTNTSAAMVVGAGSSLNTTSTGDIAATGLWFKNAATAPNPLGTTLCPAISGTITGPFSYVYDTNSSTYLPFSVVESINDATFGPISGSALEYCGRIVFNDTKVSPPTFKNAQVVINHTAGVGTAPLNQDRGLAIQASTPSGDTASRHALEGIQAEMDLFGNPVVDNSQGPDSEFTAGSFQANDRHTSLNLGPASFGVNGIRAEFFRVGGTGTWSSCAATPCMTGVNALATNLSNVAGASTSMAAVLAQVLNSSSGTNAMRAYGMYVHSAGFRLTSIEDAIYIDTSFSSSNSADGALVSDATAPSRFQGDLRLGSTLNTNSGTINGLGSINRTGGITTTAITAPIAPATFTAGTPGSTSYTYAICAVDSNGGQACSSTHTIASGNATLDGTNYINVSLGQLSDYRLGASSFKVYRTASSGTPSSTGLIGTITVPTNIDTTGSVVALADQGLAGDSTTLPATNTTGGSAIHDSQTMSGATSGSAVLGAAAAAGTPNRVNLPTATATAGDSLASDGASPQQTSWSPRAKVYACGTTTTCSATLQSAPQIVQGIVTLSGGTATVSSLPTFTSTTSFRCTASDNTTAGNGANAVPASSTSITVNGTGTDVISYHCVGN